MKFVSTRNQSQPVSYSEAILGGIAPDGGLYVPDQYPVFTEKEIKQMDSTHISSMGEKILRPFLGSSENNNLEKSLSEICKSAFNFPIPLHFIGKEAGKPSDTALLELFHGPTSAFKDVGARFLAECLVRVPEAKNKTVLVATSGDTGGAVAAAFYQKPDIQVAILYPRGKVSERQELQLTTWGENIRAFAIEGDFDDCQKMVKALLVDSDCSGQFLSANSINLGRLLPQSLYYAQASLNYLKEKGVIPGFIIPTGNLGNAVAALWAKRIGFPIREVVFSLNSNRPIVEFLNKEVWLPHQTIATLANAMDVGNPSNIERLMHLYPRISDLKKDVRAYSVTDHQISETIKDGPKTWNQVFCPHTATAMYVREKIAEKDWVIVSTAHAAKFEQIVEPLIGRKVELPPALSQILTRPKKVTSMRADLTELKAALKR